MKQLALVLLSSLTLAACSSGGDSKKTSGGNTGKSQMPAPSSYTGTRTLFTNKWMSNYGEGTVLFSFTRDSASVANYCNNGKVASLTVRAYNTSTHVQILESKEAGDADCNVSTVASAAPMSYTIRGDQLISADGALEAY